MQHIIQEEGMASLWRGLKTRVAVNVPFAAICWGTYETMKKVLTAHE